MYIHKWEALCPGENVEQVLVTTRRGNLLFCVKLVEFKEILTEKKDVTLSTEFVNVAFLELLFFAFFLLS